MKLVTELKSHPIHVKRETISNIGFEYGDASSVGNFCCALPKNETNPIFGWQISIINTSISII